VVSYLHVVIILHILIIQSIIYLLLLLLSLFITPKQQKPYNTIKHSQNTLKTTETTEKYRKRN